MKTRVALMVASTILGIVAFAHAQSLEELAKKERERRAKQATESKEITNSDLSKSVPAPPATAPPVRPTPGEKKPDAVKPNPVPRTGPEPPRELVKTMADDAVIGPVSAPVEIVEYADFEDRHSASQAPIVKKLLEIYGESIRVVFRNYPLESHRYARIAAEAAECARAQGQFWKFHDKLFSDQEQLATMDFGSLAVELVQDPTKFNACLENRTYGDRIDQHIKDAKELGVDRTPTFFINGRYLLGLAPIEGLRRVVDDELQSKGIAPPPR